MTNTRILESSSISFCKNPLETAPSSLCLGCSINKPREAALIVKWDADIMGIQGDISYGERDILYTYHYMCIYIYIMLYHWQLCCIHILHPWYLLPTPCQHPMISRRCTKPPGSWHFVLPEILGVAILIPWNQPDAKGWNIKTCIPDLKFEWNL
jgi:hypothetical protein